MGLGSARSSAGWAGGTNRDLLPYGRGLAELTHDVLDAGDELTFTRGSAARSLGPTGLSVVHQERGEHSVSYVPQKFDRIGKLLAIVVDPADTAALARLDALPTRATVDGTVLAKIA